MRMLIKPKQYRRRSPIYPYEWGTDWKRDGTATVTLQDGRKCKADKWTCDEAIGIIDWCDPVKAIKIDPYDPAACTQSYMV